MNTVPMITPGSISGMRGKSDRPVYFLWLNNSNDPNLVVKGEKLSTGLNEKAVEDAAVSIKWSSKLMNNVQNKLVNTKIMTHAEIAEFKRVAQSSFANNSAEYRFLTSPTPMVWVKMPMVEGLSDADFFTANDNLHKVKGKVVNLYDQKKTKETISKLLSEKVWVDIGKVVAVDLFNGNSDRFFIQTGEWINKGNMMFLANGQTSVIGLDTFDTQGLNRSGLNSNLNKRGTYTELLPLKNLAERQSFAEKCLKSVGTEFKRVFDKGSLNSITFIIKGENQMLPLVISADNIGNIFFELFLESFVSGLSQGADDLKIYLQRKVRDYKAAGQARLQTNVVIPGMRPQNGPGKMVPQGVIDRMTFLGW